RARNPPPKRKSQGVRDKTCTTKKGSALLLCRGDASAGPVEQSIVAEMGSYSSLFSPDPKGLRAVVDDRMEAMTRRMASSPELWFWVGGIPQKSRRSPGRAPP